MTAIVSFCQSLYLVAVMTETTLHSVDGTMVSPLDASCIIDVISATGHLPVTESLSNNDYSCALRATDKQPLRGKQGCFDVNHVYAMSLILLFFCHLLLFLLLLLAFCHVFVMKLLDNFMLRCFIFG